MSRIALILGLIAALCLPIVLSAKSPTRVRGHVRKSSGKYVAPHARTSKNKTQTDNWSSKGNTNPNTGKKGTKSPTR